MFRFNFDAKFGKDKKPIKIRPATQNTQWVEISIRNATRRKRSGSGPLSPATWNSENHDIDGCAILIDVTGKRGHYDSGLFTGGISRISKVSEFSRISRKWSDSPLFSRVW